MQEESGNLLFEILTVLHSQVKMKFVFASSHASDIFAFLVVVHFSSENAPNGPLES